MSHTDISWAKVRALPHQNLTPGLLNWQRQDTLVDLQRNLERVMVPGSLQFASAPQRLPVGQPDRERSSQQKRLLLYNVLQKRCGEV